jgi:hypothetical protein
MQKMLYIGLRERAKAIGLVRIKVYLSSSRDIHCYRNDSRYICIYVDITSGIITLFGIKHAVTPRLDDRAPLPLV